MQIDTMLSESIQLLVLGMGTVFFILLLLIACLSLMSSLFAHPAEVEGASRLEAEAVTQKASVSPGVIAAIQSAVHFYRDSSKR